MPSEKVPEGNKMTTWGKTNQELYDEAMAKHAAAKAAGLRPDPFPWLAKDGEPSAPEDGPDEEESPSDK